MIGSVKVSQGQFAALALDDEFSGWAALRPGAELVVKNLGGGTATVDLEQLDAYLTDLTPVYGPDPRTVTNFSSIAAGLPPGGTHAVFTVPPNQWLIALSVQSTGRLGWFDGPEFKEVSEVSAAPGFAIPPGADLLLVNDSGSPATIRIDEFSGVLTH